MTVQTTWSRWFAAAAFAVAGSVSALASDSDFHAGVTAFNAGNYEKARRIIAPLAVKGDGEAQLYMGRMVKDALGGPGNASDAKLWFHRAAQFGVADAQYELAMYFVDDGLETKKDLDRAAMWMTKSAMAGSGMAQMSLALMHRDGLGVPKNAKIAVMWMAKAAAKGLPEAQYQYGIMHYQGKLMPQDYMAAAKWTLKAAEQGHVKAQVNVGFIYASGTGLPKNMVEAHKWFNLAAARGDMEGLQGREALARRMSPPQVAKAQALATVWKPKRTR